MKPICVPCQRFYRPKRNGFFFIEGMPRAGVNGAKPGLKEPHLWQPYKLWCGDKWYCPNCGSEIIVGTGMNPIAERYQDNFADQIKTVGATLQINDC